MKVKFAIILSLILFSYQLKADSFHNKWEEDKAVVSINCPADFEIECGWEWGQYDEYGNLISTNTGAATAGNKEVEADINDLTNGCGVGVIEIEWCVKYGDNPKCCTQEITITQAASPWDPNNINFQNDVSLDCVDEVTSPVKPQWGEGLCDLVAWTSKDLELYFEEDACYKVIRTYTVVNWCTDETVTHNTYLTVLDDTPPIITCTDQMFGITNTECNIGVSLTKSAVDGDSNCSSDWLEWKAEVDLWGDGTVDYTWSFAEGADENFREDRDDDLDGIYYLPKDTDVTINIPELIDNSCNNHTVKWSVNDGCNNFASCTETFMVVDKKAPTPYCISVSSAVMVNGEVELWASDFNLGATDNCTEQAHLLFSFSDNVYQPNRTFTCGDDPDGDGIIQLPVYVWDDACTPNVEFCNVSLTLSNCGAGGIPITGKIRTEEGEEVTSVNVTIHSDGVINYPMTYLTDSVGDYSFYYNTLALDYSINPSSNDNYMEGVSTLDLLLIKKHIIGEQAIDSPYKMIAADINKSGHISAVDLVHLRKLILGVYKTLPANNSWRFINAAQNLTMENLWDCKEQLVVSNLSTDTINGDFIGVKIGDINGSYTSDLDTRTTQNRSVETLSLEFVDRELEKGETTSISFMSSNFKNIYGFQMTISLEGLTAVNLKGGTINITDANFALLDNVITMSVDDPKAINASANEVLFTIEITANKSGKLSAMIDINSTITTAEAYIGETLAIANVELNTRTNGDPSLVKGYKLYQNEPNPYNLETQIGFTLPEANTATITIYTVTGKVIQRIVNDYEQGYNTLSINTSDLPARGVFYYQLESGDFKETKKMIVIE